MIPGFQDVDLKALDASIWHAQVPPPPPNSILFNKMSCCAPVLEMSLSGVLLSPESWTNISLINGSSLLCWEACCFAGPQRM